MRTASRRPKRFYGPMTFEKAEQARRAYFVERKKQKDIAADLGIRQGSVSRILSGQVW